VCKGEEHSLTILLLFSSAPYDSVKDGITVPVDIMIYFSYRNV
jgi:hypothetical protein